jgi:hypothetical protein
MDKKPYHHLPDGTFRNPEGSPKRDPNIKWSYKIFNEERKKIKIRYPESHVVPREQALKNLDAINSDEEKVLLKVNRKKGDQKKKSKTKDW